MQFDMTNVLDGWKYFIKTYYYSEGTQTSLKGTSTYTIVIPEEPTPDIIPGDVNSDGKVNIDDVTDLIDYLLGIAGDNLPEAADVDKDGKVNIDDVTTLIDMLLGNK